MRTTRIISLWGLLIATALMVATVTVHRGATGTLADTSRGKPITMGIRN